MATQAVADGPSSIRSVRCWRSPGVRDEDAEVVERPSSQTGQGRPSGTGRLPKVNNGPQKGMRLPDIPKRTKTS